MFLVFLFKESLNFSVILSNQSWCLRDTGPRESIAEVNGVSEDCPALLYIF